MDSTRVRQIGLRRVLPQGTSWQPANAWGSRWEAAEAGRYYLGSVGPYRPIWFCSLRMEQSWSRLPLHGVMQLRVGFWLEDVSTLDFPAILPRVLEDCRAEWWDSSRNLGPRGRSRRNRIRLLQQLRTLRTTVEFNPSATEAEAVVQLGRGLGIVEARALRDPEEAVEIALRKPIFRLRANLRKLENLLEKQDVEGLQRALYQWQSQLGRLIARVERRLRRQTSSLRPSPPTCSQLPCLELGLIGHPQLDCIHFDFVGFPRGYHIRRLQSWARSTGRRHILPRPSSQSDWAIRARLRRPACDSLLEIAFWQPLQRGPILTPVLSELDWTRARVARVPLGQLIERAQSWLYRLTGRGLDHDGRDLLQSQLDRIRSCLQWLLRRWKARSRTRVRLS